MSSRSFRNRNPGNLRYGPFAQAQGAIGQDERNLAVFATSARGFQAMLTLLSGGTYAKLSIAEALARYAPASDGNQPDRYVSFVCQQTGLAPQDCLGQLTCPQRAGLAWAMAMFEGWLP
jgi:hypothetical protein